MMGEKPVPANAGKGGITEVVTGELETPLVAQPRKPPPRSQPKWETVARDRTRTAVRRYTKPVEALIARDANEGDTRVLVTDFLCEGLGWDKFEDLTMEYLVKGEFADYGLRIAKQLIAFVEVKRCTTKLGAKHLHQVEMYSVNEGVEWMILTNGQVWQLWHLTMGRPVILDLALEADLLGEGGPAHKAATLFYLSKEAFRHRAIDELWKVKSATSAKSLASVITGERMLEEIRKELRRQTRHSIDTTELHELLLSTVIRPEVLPGRK